VRGILSPNGEGCNLFTAWLSPLTGIVGQMERPEAPVTGERRGPSTAAWVGAVVLWLLMSIPNALRSGDENGAQTVGALFGGLLSTLVIALLLRFVYVRLMAKGRALWSPWVFVIAAGLALLVNLGQAADEAETASGALQQPAHPLGEPPQRLRWVALQANPLGQEPVVAQGHDVTGGLSSRQRGERVARLGDLDVLVRVVHQL